MLSFTELYEKQKQEQISISDFLKLYQELMRRRRWKGACQFGGRGGIRVRLNTNITGGGHTRLDHVIICKD